MSGKSKTKKQAVKSVIGVFDLKGIGIILLFWLLIVSVLLVSSIPYEKNQKTIDHNVVSPVPFVIDTEIIPYPGQIIEIQITILKTKDSVNISLFSDSNLITIFENLTARTTIHWGKKISSYLESSFRLVISAKTIFELSLQTIVKGVPYHLLYLFAFSLAINVIYFSFSLIRKVRSKKYVERIISNLDEEISLNVERNFSFPHLFKTLFLKDYSNFNWLAFQIISFTFTFLLYFLSNLSSPWNVIRFYSPFVNSKYNPTVFSHKVFHQDTGTYSDVYVYSFAKDVNMLLLLDDGGFFRNVEGYDVIIIIIQAIILLYPLLKDTGKRTGLHEASLPIPSYVLIFSRSIALTIPVYTYALINFLTTLFLTWILGTVTVSIRALATALVLALLLTHGLVLLILLIFELFKNYSLWLFFSSILVILMIVWNSAISKIYIIFKLTNKNNYNHYYDVFTILMEWLFFEIIYFALMFLAEFIYQKHIFTKLKLRVSGKS